MYNPIYNQTHVGLRTSHLHRGLAELSLSDQGTLNIYRLQGGGQQFGKLRFNPYFFCDVMRFIQCGAPQLCLLV